MCVVLFVINIFPAYVSSTRAAFVVVLTVNARYPLWVHAYVPPRKRECSRSGLSSVFVLYSASWRNLLDSEDAPRLPFVGRNRNRFRRVYFLRAMSGRFRAGSLRALLFVFLFFCI